MSKEKDIVKKEEGKVVPRLSGDQNLPAGFDEVDKEDLKIPRLAILQGLSQIVVEGKARMGQLANSLTKEVFSESVEFIPLFMFKTRAKFEKGRGLVMFSRDNVTVTMAIEEFAEYQDRPVEEVPGANWEGDNSPTFNLVYNFPVLLVGRLNEFPISISLMKTATKAAKGLLSMARFSGEDMFARVYTIKTKIEQNENGTYAVPVLELARRATDEEYIAASKCFNEWYRRKKDISVDLEEETTVKEQPTE